MLELAVRLLLIFAGAFVVGFRLVLLGAGALWLNELAEFVLCYARSLVGLSSGELCIWERR